MTTISITIYEQQASLQGTSAKNLKTDQEPNFFNHDTELWYKK